MNSKIASTYIIKKGDTLFNIAQQQLNSRERWHEILLSDSTRFGEPVRSHGRTIH